MTFFTLNAQLEADTFTLGQFGLSRVLLMNDARYPWLILVPERAAIEELIDLPEADRTQLMCDVTAASEALKTIYAPDKLNVGALGNKVRQLHVHVIARFVSDETWPGPVWGVGKARPYPPHMSGVVMDQLIAALTAQGMKAAT
jgi:diadenosine tetraphosphate (Ap4A) HIT family hydrolase